MIRDLLVWKRKGEWEHMALTEYSYDSMVRHMHEANECVYPVWSVNMDGNSNYNQFYVYQNDHDGFEVVPSDKIIPKEVKALVMIYGESV